MAGYELCQALHYRALSHAGLTYEYGVVFLPAPQDFHHALYLFLPSHHGVELAFRRRLGEVYREVVYHGGLAVALRLRCRGLLPCVVVALLCRWGVLVGIVHVLVGQADAVFRSGLA